MRKLIERCPGCGGEMAVHRMECQQCHTAVEGRFRPSAFDRLSPESLAFVELFVRLKGNTKQMERELGVPYSTVRSRLDEVVGELGSRPQLQAPASGGAPACLDHQREILDRLNRGDIGTDQAITELGGES